ncbi:MAG: hypothetical protein IJ124_05580 [Clostridia bacterium]|nr:hypothetical protein [Clostridia bacterium]
MLSKNPILNGILTCVLGAAGVALFNFVMSLIRKTSFMEEIGGRTDLIIDVVICIMCGVIGYMQAKKAAK